MAITRDEIIQAAEALERDGEKATMASVREFLGGGSFATISPVLREWKEGRKSTQSVVLEMPGELKAVMERQGSEFWQAASRLANEKLITVQTEADNAVADAQAERDETLQEVARLESAMANLGEQVLSADKQKEEAQAAHNQLQTETIRLHEKLAGSQAEIGRLRDEVDQVGQEKDRQAGEASRLQGLNEELNRELAEARQQATEASRLRVLNEEMKRELNEARQQLDAERQRASDNALEAGSLKRELEQSTAAQERLQGSLETQQTETLALKTSTATLEARLEDRNGKVAQLETELADLREVWQQDVQQTANLTAERDAGKARIRELVKDFGELQQENKTLLLVNAKLKSGGDLGA